MFSINYLVGKEYRIYVEEINEDLCAWQAIPNSKGKPPLKGMATLSLIKFDNESSIMFEDLEEFAEVMQEIKDCAECIIDPLGIKRKLTNGS